jgi:hypothetical protein
MSQCEAVTEENFKAVVLIHLKHICLIWRTGASPAGVLNRSWKIWKEFWQLVKFGQVDVDTAPDWRLSLG